VRISAQLIDSSTEFLLWADDFDGDLQDVFAMQEQTALRIAEELDLTLTPQEQREVQRRSTGNPEAYDEYLRAHALIQDWSNQDKLETARRHLERALKLDPEYAPALAGLAGIDAQIYRNMDSREERLRQAEELAERAIRIDPQLARAHMAMAEVSAVAYDYRRAGKYLRTAIELEPGDPYLWDLYSWVLGYQQPPDAVGAEEAARQALRLQANFPGAYYHLGRALLHQGRQQEAKEAFEHALELNPEFRSGNGGLAQYYLAVGDYERAHEQMAISFEMGAGAINYFHRSRVYAAQGEAGKAIEDLEQAFNLGFRDLAGIDACAEFDGLRNDPRFRDLVERYRE
jgi:tetratricopeptide (TPR) repeat protein